MDKEILKEKYERIKPFLDEKSRRLYVANEAIAKGWGGVSRLSEATGMSREVIGHGISEIKEGSKAMDNDISATVKENHSLKKRIRKVGGGRKKIEKNDAALRYNLEQLMDPITRGDPESPLLWTSKSIRKITALLNQKGHRVSHETVRALLRGSGYSLQANFKTIEKNQHEDRDEQFEYLYRSVKEAQSKKQPVISIDAKKKELVGEFKNNGQEWRPKGKPERVNAHDFEDKTLGKAIPFGIYDITENQGWVSVGIDHDTSQFAVSSIRSWWNEMGKDTYPDATEITITADCGGSNGNRRRLWKTELQRFADETSMALHILHYPPGTSKWNKIEHRMFSFISKNWRGKPLTSLEVIVNLISCTTTNTGLKINCSVDDAFYPTGTKVTDNDLNSVNLIRDNYHGDWNYRIFPHVFDKVIY
jgi:hypothetical protein